MQVFRTDTYFLDSASNVSFFLEEKALDSNGELQQDKALSINKIGHGEGHLLHALLCAMSLHAPLSTLLPPDNALLHAPSVTLPFLAAALHDLDPVFRRFSRGQRVAQLLRSLRYQKPLPVQSMYIFKVSSTVHCAACASGSSGSLRSAAMPDMRIDKIASSNPRSAGRCGRTRTAPS
jgi:phytanoyl-CoA hydroxylase